MKKGVWTMPNERTDPWSTIVRPSALASLSALRVDGKHPWNIYWAVDADKNCLLTLQHSREVQRTTRLPRLRGIDIGEMSSDSNSENLLVIKLLAQGEKELFYRLCMDIISATVVAETEREAIERFIGRTWRWHRLLKGGPDGRLTRNEQQGLIGELQFLELHLLQTIGMNGAVKSWMGPLGTPKDFNIGRKCVEVKARRGTTSPHVVITSEHQLDSDGLEALFLYVIDVTPDVGENHDGITVTEAAQRLHSAIKAQDPVAGELFEERLYASGFDWADDYNDDKWLVGQERLFEVRDDFPRITPFAYANGVDKVRYSISLSACEPFSCDLGLLYKSLSGGE